MNEINVNHPMYGKCHSEYSKKLMSDAHRGKKLSEEHKRKISESMKGLKRTEENCKHISDGLKGKYVGEKASMYGRKHNPETIKIMSEKRKKKWENDDEYRERISENLRNVNIGRCGPRSPKWKGGPYPFWYGENWNKQRKKAIKRDEYSCSICGKSNNLDVHHLVSVRNFLSNIIDIYSFEEPHNVSLIKLAGYDCMVPHFIWDEINSLDNIITLCKRCHRAIERGAQ